MITYQIPDRLEGVDRDFFALRWSEAWTQATMDRLAEKYSIPREEPGLRKIGIYVRIHRQRVVAKYPRLRSLLGESLHEKFRRLVGRRLEKRLNLRQYPLAEYVRNRKIEARVVNG